MSSKRTWDERLNDPNGLGLTDTTELGDFDTCLVSEALKSAGVDYVDMGFYVKVNGEPEVKLSSLGLGYEGASFKTLDGLERWVRVIQKVGGPVPIVRWGRERNVEALKAQKKKIDDYVRENYPKKVWEPEPTIDVEFTVKEGQKEKEGEKVNG